MNVKLPRNRMQIWFKERTIVNFLTINYIGQGSASSSTNSKNPA